MSLIARTIAQLFGGVSQQPDQLRSDSQCDYQDNCWPDVAVGLSKRPSSAHVAKLNTDTGTTRAVHVINRDVSEKYTVLVADGEVKVYDLLTGAAKTVTIADGTSYLSSANPRSDFAFLTVADTTFIVNKTVTVGMDTSSDTSLATRWAKVTLVSVPAEATGTSGACTGAAFKITVDGVVYTSNQTTGKTKATHINDLASAITTARPDLQVTGDGVESITIDAPAGQPLAVSAVVLDESTYTVYSESGSENVCRLTANGSKVKVTQGGALNGPVGFVYIVAAVARQTYSVTLAGSTYSFTVAADGSNALTTTVADGLRTAIPSATYTVDRIGSAIRIQRNDGAAFSFSAVDSYGDQGLIYFTDSVEGQGQLPTNFWTDYTIKVRGDGTTASNPFYVKFEDSQWKETVGPGLDNSLDASTMPHKLVRNSDGTFTFSKIDWKSREVGDEDSSPVPSFVGQKINNMFFYRERLGFLSGENVVMSKATDYFNFFRSTVATVLDDDPIDLTVADTRVSQLYHALSFQEALLIFADTAQYQLTGGEVLSPKTARLDATTRFYSTKDVPPVSAGRDVYFAVSRGNHMSLREYFVLPDGINSDAVDVTAHVPSYVPANLGGLVGANLLDALFMFSRDEPNRLYIYKYLWSGDQKVQSAWGTITFSTDATIMGIEAIDTVLYLVIKRADGTYLEKMDFQAGLTETGMSFRVYLDRRYSLTGVYNATTKQTTWTLPHADTEAYQVVLGSSFGTKAGALIQTTHPTSTTVVANGDYSGGACFVGKPYTMRYRFSQLFIKGQDKQAVLNGKLQLRTMGVSYTDSAFFKAEVTPLQRDKSTHTFTGTLLGTASATLGRINISSGVFRFPIITSNEGVSIELVNDSPLPSVFQSATWEGFFIQRAGRA